jgi:SAM-dependent methyltransferase
MAIERLKRLIRTTSRLGRGTPKNDPPAPVKKISETSKCRGRLAPFCVGDGLDVGYGGDPIVPHAICMDLSQKYAAYESHVQHLHGDATNLHWFRDGVLDWVYSSHVLEDFHNTSTVLSEWLRVLRVGGRLILFLPDEQLYRAFCKSQGKPPNAHHIHEHFGPAYIKDLLALYPGTRIIHEANPVDIYSFEIVIEKTDSLPK